MYPIFKNLSIGFINGFNRLCLLLASFILFEELIERFVNIKITPSDFLFLQKACPYQKIQVTRSCDAGNIQLLHLPYGIIISTYYPIFSLFP